MGDLLVPFKQETEEIVIFPYDVGILPPLDLNRGDLTVEIIISNKINKKVFKRVWDYLFENWGDTTKFSVETTTSNFVWSDVNAKFILNLFNEVFNRVDLYKVTLTPTGEHKWSILVK